MDRGLSSVSELGFSPVPKENEPSSSIEVTLEMYHSFTISGK